MSTLAKKTFGRALKKVKYSKILKKKIDDSVPVSRAQQVKDNVKGNVKTTAKEEGYTKLTNAVKSAVSVKSFDDAYTFIREFNADGYETLMLDYYTGAAGNDLFAEIQGAVTDLFRELGLTSSDAAEIAAFFVQELKLNVTKVDSTTDATIKSISSVLEVGFGSTDFGTGNSGFRFVGPDTILQDLTWLAGGESVPEEVMFVVDVAQNCFNFVLDPVGTTVSLVASGVDYFLKSMSTLEWDADSVAESAGRLSLELLMVATGPFYFVWAEFNPWAMKEKRRLEEERQRKIREAQERVRILKETYRQTVEDAGKTSDGGLPPLHVQHHARLWQYDERTAVRAPYWTAKLQEGVFRTLPFTQAFMEHSAEQKRVLAEHEHFDPARQGARRLYPVPTQVPGFENPRAMAYSPYQVAAAALCTLQDPAAAPAPAAAATNSHAAFFVGAQGDQTVGHNFKGALSDRHRVPDALVAAATRSAFAAVLRSGQVACWGHPLEGGSPLPAGGGDAASFAANSGLPPAVLLPTLQAQPFDRAPQLVHPPAGYRAVRVVATSRAFLLLSRGQPGQYHTTCWGMNEFGGRGDPGLPTHFTNCPDGGPRVFATDSCFFLVHPEVGFVTWGRRRGLDEHHGTSGLRLERHLYDDGSSPGAGGALEQVGEGAYVSPQLGALLHLAFPGHNDYLFVVYGPERRLAVCGPGPYTLSDELGRAGEAATGVVAVLPSSSGPASQDRYSALILLRGGRFRALGGSAKDLVPGLLGPEAAHDALHCGNVAAAAASAGSYALILSTGSLLFLGPVVTTLPDTSVLHPAAAAAELAGQRQRANCLGALPLRRSRDQTTAGWKQYSPAEDVVAARPFVRVVANTHGAFVALRANSGGRAGWEAHVFGLPGVGGRGGWSEQEDAGGGAFAPGTLLAELRSPERDLLAVVPSNRGFAAVFSDGRAVYWGDLGTDPSTQQDWERFGSVQLPAVPSDVQPLENGFAFVCSGVVYTVGAMVTDCLATTDAQRASGGTAAAPYVDVRWEQPSALEVGPGRTTGTAAAPAPGVVWYPDLADDTLAGREQLRRFAPELVLAGWVDYARVEPVDPLAEVPLAGGGSLAAGECYQMCRLFDRFGALPRFVPFRQVTTAEAGVTFDPLAGVADPLRRLYATEVPAAVRAQWPWTAEDAEDCRAVCQSPALALGGAGLAGALARWAAEERLLDPLPWLFLVAQPLRASAGGSALLGSAQQQHRLAERVAAAAAGAAGDAVPGTSFLAWVRQDAPASGLSPLRALLAWLAAVRALPRERGSLGGLADSARAALAHGLGLLHAELGQAAAGAALTAARTTDPDEFELLAEVAASWGAGPLPAGVHTVRVIVTPATPPVTFLGDVVVRTADRGQLSGAGPDPEQEAWLCVHAGGVDIVGVEKLPPVNISVRRDGRVAANGNTPLSAGGPALDLGHLALRLLAADGASGAVLFQRTGPVDAGSVAAAVTEREVFPASAGEYRRGWCLAPGGVVAAAGWPAGPAAPATPAGGALWPGPLSLTGMVLPASSDSARSELGALVHHLLYEHTKLTDGVARAAPGTPLALHHVHRAGDVMVLTLLSAGDLCYHAVLLRACGHWHFLCGSRPVASSLARGPRPSAFAAAGSVVTSSLETWDVTSILEQVTEFQKEVQLF